MAASPSTLSRRTNVVHESALLHNEVIQTLSEWDLQLEGAKSGDSPSRRLLRAKTTEQRICQSNIQYLSFKDPERLHHAVRRFNGEAEILYKSWVNKPKADRDVLPRPPRTQRRKVLNNDQRLHMQKTLLKILLEAVDEYNHENGKSPSKLRTLDSFDSDASEKSPHPGTINTRKDIDDRAYPFPALSKSSPSSKRPRENPPDDRAFKVPRLPEQISMSSLRNGVSDSILSGLPSQVRKEPKSAATSFTSNASSVFSRPSSFTGKQCNLTQSTQTTVDNDDEDDCLLDIKLEQLEVLEKSHDDKTQSSDYFGSSFDPRDLEVFSINDLDESGFGSRSLEDILQEDLLKEFEREIEGVGDDMKPNNAVVHSTERLQQRLRGIFPELPSCLKTVPLCVSYEVTRIFLYAEVPMAGLKLPRSLQVTDYNTLWRYLRKLPALEGKPFPERCSPDSWDCALERDYNDLFRGITLSGALHFRPEGPLFKLQLSPLKLELSHRFGRRFGNDRFFEVDIPDLFPNKSDNPTKQLLRDARESGRGLVIDWLFNETHNLFGRVWKPFYIKLKDGRDKRAESREAPDKEITAYRVYFFAVDGQDFIDSTTSVATEAANVHDKMSVHALLNWLRPNRMNKRQPYLKLFSRTSLALSRSYQTVILERNQIRYKPDIIESNGEVMTDGGGQISLKLALVITQKLKLSHPPSGFQARIGEAKGFWSVDYRDRTGEEWIDVYDSQRKWTRSTKEDDELHRTFEVLNWSGPLSSADLNTQLLPILVSNARRPRDMQLVISQLLEDGLTQEMTNLHAAMNDPQLFRKWIRDEHPNLKHRLQTGVVQFKAGLPEKHEEKIMTLLDAGFDPKNLSFLNELVMTSYKTKCDTLKKRMNITVGKSCYAYMVPDFSAVLEPDEVYLDFSSFTDETGLSGVLLNNGVEILVARSPAHYVSDIQKVKAVCKVELIGLKDVIVFSAKGPSLASKLSGGDYDGDLAWVCWEPRIVSNFKNAEVPLAPDLVAEGWITKNSTSYETLVARSDDRTTKFLRHSFDFNMQQSLLGTCTNFKEKLCAMQGRVDSKEAVDLSTLLSNLVDQAKQGFGFTTEDWTRFKREKIKVTAVRTPAYKEERLDPRSKHILDRLQIVAHEMIERTKTKFHQQFPTIKVADMDLLKYFNTAKENASTEEEWKALIDHLQREIAVVRDLWGCHFPYRGPKDDDFKREIGPALAECLPAFQNILPPNKTSLTKALLPGCLIEPELSEWALYRASTAYSMFYKSNFPWWMAGKELVHLKTKCREGSDGSMTTLAPHMYAMLKPDATFIKLSRSEEHDPLFWEAKNQGEVEDEDGSENDIIKTGTGLRRNGISRD